MVRQCRELKHWDEAKHVATGPVSGIRDIDQHRPIRDRSLRFSTGKRQAVRPVLRHRRHTPLDDGGLDRDTALAFELERVGLGCALINAADLADNTGVEQDSFG